MRRLLKFVPLPVWIGLLIVSHAAVAFATWRHFDTAQQVRELTKERDQLQVQVRVAHDDTVAASAMADALRDKDLKIKEVTDALRDANRICLDAPDGDRVRDLLRKHYS